MSLKEALLLKCNRRSQAWTTYDAYNFTALFSGGLQKIQPAYASATCWT